ncbi:MULTISPECIES: hypothetical protein [Lysobacter]|uniref:hypothetical protein n=1 Tax=Lysobacter TaxID=68 RepID=UPI001F397C5A|nr:MULTISPECIES: hypothetical protein [Lysobacter]UJB21666.1 hypothetical protein L1A79_11695 [Lysobacter capsici]UJQ29217.1 hypothetical protein L2D09_03170 [Lysobacter gummosus]
MSAAIGVSESKYQAPSVTSQSIVEYSTVHAEPKTSAFASCAIVRTSSTSTLRAGAYDSQHIVSEIGFRYGGESPEDKVRIDIRYRMLHWLKLARDVVRQ